MKTKLIGILAALTLVLSACLPGIPGAAHDLPVQVTAEHEAVATLTSPGPIVDVIVYVGGAGAVPIPSDLRFQCERYRNGHRCDIRTQRNPQADRITIPAGAIITFTAVAEDATGITASAWWTPAD